MGSRKIIICLVVVLAAPLIRDPEIVYAANDPAVTCTSISISDSKSGSNIMLEIGPDGTVMSESATVRVVVDAPPPNEFGFDPKAYKFSYKHENYPWGSGSITQDILFDQGGPEGNPGTRQWGDTFTITLDRVGTWNYTIQGPNGYVVGSGGGCFQGTESSFEVTTEQINPTAEYTTSCEIVASRTSEAVVYNHYTCITFPNRSVYGKEYCDTAAGYEPDYARCEGGTGLTATNYCLPCISEAERANIKTVGHFDKCTKPGDTESDGKTILECDKSVTDLQCVRAPATGISAPGEYVCIVGESRLAPGEQCYVGANECEEFPKGRGVDNVSVLYSCQPDPNNISYLGACKASNDSSVQKCSLDSQCASNSNFGAGFKCDADWKVCVPGTTFDPGGSGGGNGGAGGNLETDQHGARNCPGVKSTGGGEDGSTVRYFADVSNSESVNCVRCINAKGTWTALGCIITTPEGIFNTLIRVAIGIMGGVALLRLIYLGYLYNFGGEDKVKPAAQDILATLGGLLLVIFSVLILRFLGVNVLDVVPQGFFG